MLFWILVGLPAALMVINATQALFAWWYVRGWRKNPPALGRFTPRAAIFVPCKGLDPDLDANLDAVAMQDYPDYTVTYIVESANDPAYDAIRRVAARNPHAGAVVAGLSRNCGQKNHNLLEGIAARGGNAEVFVFCDSDTRPDRTWLRRMVAPLEDPKTPVSTGFRWILPGEGRRTFAGYLHAMFNGYMSTLAANKAFAAVWGGSMALRRDFWERHRVAEKWSTSVVDDMTVSEILLKSGEKRTYVLSCLTVSDEAIPDLKRTLDWFARQIIYVRYYLLPLWLLVLVVHTLTALTVLGWPVLFYAWAATGSEALLWGGVAGALFTLYFIGQALLVRSLGSPNFSAWRWALYAPIGTVLGPYCIWLSAVWRSLKWRDTTYFVGAGGRVLRIERATHAAPVAAPEAELLPQSLNKE
jgi:cellulose synthase/poly-beta-1,6-N-acetylglucosamine synthase-like glycosyltransferase